MQSPDRDAPDPLDGPRPPAAALPLETVRHATRDLHSRLERLPCNVRLLAADFELAEYRAALLRMYGFYVPLAHHAAAADVSWASRVGRRVRDLAADLHDLGMTPAELTAAPFCDALPRLDGPDRALGCGYVIEGSALGGRVIVRHLAQQFAQHPGVGFRFFSGDGDATGASWRRFCAELNGRAGDVAEICAGARSTFDALFRWLESAPDGDGAPPC